MLKRRLSAPPTATPGPRVKTLKQGSKGSAVLKLQKREALGIWTSCQRQVRLHHRLRGQTVPSMSGLKRPASPTRHPVRIVRVRREKVPMLSASVKLGDKGTGVKRLQARLRAKATSRTRSTACTPRPPAGRRGLPGRGGLKQDGVAGPATLRSLRLQRAQGSAKPAASPNPRDAQANRDAKPTNAQTRDAQADPRRKAHERAQQATSSKVEKGIACQDQAGKPLRVRRVRPSSTTAPAFDGRLRLGRRSLPLSAATIATATAKR